MTVCHLQLLRTLASLMSMRKTYFAINRPTLRTMVTRPSIIKKWTAHHRKPLPHLQPKPGCSLHLNFGFDLEVILSTPPRRSHPRSPRQKLLISASLLRDSHPCLTVRQGAKARTRSRPSPDAHRLKTLSARLKPAMQPMVVNLVVFGYVLC